MSIKVRLGFIFVQILLVLLVFSSDQVQGQKRDSTIFLKFKANMTNNGISFIPSFSIGKPALILEPTIGNKRFSFEPQLRFSLDGKPWAFIFIYRYKLINQGKFSLQVGGYLPSLVFSNHKSTQNGKKEDITETNRYLVAELIPNYKLSENVTIGLFLLRGFGLDPGAIQDTYYAGFRSSITNINLTRRIYFKFIPQVYYLKTDRKDGFYFTNTLTMALRNFPLSISSIVNKAIQTEIHGKDFDWNIGLVYSFEKHFVRRQK